MSVFGQANAACTFCMTPTPPDQAWGATWRPFWPNCAATWTNPSIPSHAASGWATANASRSAKAANSPTVESCSPPATGIVVLRVSSA